MTACLHGIWVLRGEREWVCQTCNEWRADAHVRAEVLPNGSTIYHEIGVVGLDGRADGGPGISWVSGTPTLPVKHVEFSPGDLADPTSWRAHMWSVLTADFGIEKR